MLKRSFSYFHTDAKWIFCENIQMWPVQQNYPAFSKNISTHCEMWLTAREVCVISALSTIWKLFSFKMGPAVLLFLIVLFKFFLWSLQGVSGCFFVNHTHKTWHKTFRMRFNVETRLMYMKYQTFQQKLSIIHTFMHF